MQVGMAYLDFGLHVKTYRKNLHSAYVIAISNTLATQQFIYKRQAVWYAVLVI